MFSLSPSISTPYPPIPVCTSAFVSHSQYLHLEMVLLLHVYSCVWSGPWRRGTCVGRRTTTWTTMWTWIASLRHLWPPQLPTILLAELVPLPQICCVLCVNRYLLCFLCSSVFSPGRGGCYVWSTLEAIHLIILPEFVRGHIWGRNVMHGVGSCAWEELCVPAVWWW